MRYLQLYGAAALMLIYSSCATSGHRSTAPDIGPVQAGAIGQMSGQDAEVTITMTSGDTVMDRILNKEMDSFDRRQLNYAYERGPAGLAVAWVNPDTGNAYQVISQFAVKVESGKICRQSELVAYLDGKRQTFDFMACRGSGGGWVLQ